MLLNIYRLDKSIVPEYRRKEHNEHFCSTFHYYFQQPIAADRSVIFRCFELPPVAKVYSNEAVSFWFEQRLRF